MKPLILTSLLLSTLATPAFSAPQSGKNPLAELPFANQTSGGFDLKFNQKNYRELTADFNGQPIKFRAFEKIVYIKNPVEAEYQTLNFYVPEAYFNQGEINGYTAQTAPIFLPNAVGGYMPAMAAVPQAGRDGKPNAIIHALAKGYVVASVGARGRTLGKEGNYTGKAPAVIIDLKSAVRYLHANDALMAGDANKIISNGTSAGGAVSALLGASGDQADYAGELKALGAAEASDAIFAVSSYCPITNLENADAAYEWEFNGVNEFSRMDMSKLNSRTYNDRSKPMPRIEGTLTAEQIQISNQLKQAFPAYLNSLNLKDEQGNPLTLDVNGNGSFKDYMAKWIAQSANQAVKNGKDLTAYAWLKFKNGEVGQVDWQGYVHSAKRMKSPPAFDALDLSSGENNLFGDKTTNNKHFTPFAMQNSQVPNAQMAEANIVKMLNPMSYLDNPKMAQHWRIRVGSEDRDTSHAISAILATKLKMQGKNVDYFIPWGVPHSGDYDLDQLFEWADRISKTQ